MIAKLPPWLRRRLGLRARSRIPYDDLVRVRFAERAYMVTDVADVRHLLVTNEANYVKTPLLSGPQGKRRAGGGLLTSSGAAHRRQRRLLQPLFQQRMIEGFAGIVDDRTRRMLAGWRQTGEVDVAREMSELALSVLAGMLFGIDFDDEDGSLAKAIRSRRRYTEYVYHSRLPLREHLPTRAVRENREAIATLDRIIYAAIDARRASPGASAPDMTSRLITARYPDGSRMTDAQVRDELLTLTSTGHETIGDALGWTWYLLAQHPAVEGALLAELARVLGGRALRAADLAKLAYTDAVLSESLRLYPPTWIYVRVPLADDVLPSGHRVRAGSTLYLCPWVLHRHPRYFPDPERFEPERFHAEAVAARPKFAYLPFGGGTHTCIGEAFARMEGALVLAHLVPRVRLELSPRQTIVPEPGVTLYPKFGIRVHVMERD